MNQYRSAIAALTVTLAASASAQDARSLPDLTPATKLYRAHAFTESLHAEERLISVPENRNDDASRMITVHYILLPAQKDVGLPPVFILPGGPGDRLLAEDIRRGVGRRRYSRVAEIEAYNQVRDVVIVNQRGVDGTPASTHLPKSWTSEPAAWSKPLSFAESAERLSRGYAASISRCEQLGFDLRGYDILHLVDDVDAIRRAHAYDRIALRGASFGSQWALTYLHRKPQYVERMLLSGVEPVDFGYDSADGVWNVLARVEAEARIADNLSLPDVGLLGAVKEIVLRLEEEPVRVRGYHPRKGYPADVAIGADDFRHYLVRPILDSRRHSREMFTWWPKFVMEILHEDYQYLAAKIIDDRPETGRHGLLMTLVDNSLGISSDRERALAVEESRRWLGDINRFYTATRSANPTQVVGNDMRRQPDFAVPLLMVHGTLDLATPIENSAYLLRHFSNAKLIKVKGGTHAATHHAASIDSRFLSYLTSFMNTDEPLEVLGKIPSEITMPPLAFKANDGESLFTKLTGKKEALPRTRR